jgi:hypothetical protein
VRVEWRAGAGAGALSLRPSGPGTLLAVAPETRRLLATLSDWKAGAGPADAPAGTPPAAGPPAIGVVTGLSPRVMAHPRSLVPTALYTAVFAAAAAVFLGLPLAPARAGFGDVFAIAMLVQIALRIPIWRHRERAAAPAAEIRRAA